MLAQRIVRENARVAYFAPTYGMAAEVWRDMKAMLAPITTSANAQQHRIETLNGGSLDVWTTTNETARGNSYHFVVIDEAALIPTAEIWQATIRPLLTDTRGGALFCSTPRGRNWFWELYALANQPEIQDFHAWNHPTSANPYIHPEEIESARQNLPARVFQQEYLAHFLQDGSAVFSNIYDRCIAPITAPEPNRQYVFGIDWGRDKDYTAVSILDAKSLTQVRLERFNGLSYSLQRDRIRDLYNRYQPKSVYAESNSIGAVNIEELCKDGIPAKPFTTTNQSKRQIIEALVLALENQSITLQDNDTLRAELSAYQIERLASGGYTYNAPAGIHDDTIIATAISLWAAQNLEQGIFIAFV